MKEIKISTGKIKQPHIIVLYGPDGVGKSTFASEAPSPIFIGAEKGSANIDVARIEDVSTFADVRNSVIWLAEQKHNYKTVVIDSLDWLEPKLWKEICDLDPNKPEVIENAFGGYGKGFTRANQMWAQLMSALEVLREKRKMNVIAIAHSQVKAFNDPTQMVPYDRYIMKLNEKAAALWREFADCVFFLNYDVSVKKDSNNARKGKAVGDGETILYTKRTAAYDAKNRYGLPPEINMVLGQQWDAFVTEVEGAPDPDSLDAVLKELHEISSRASAENQKNIETGIEKANGDLAKLLNVRKHARKLEG